MSAPLSLCAPLSADQRAVLRTLLPGPLSVPEILARLRSDPLGFWRTADITRERIDGVLRRLRDADLVRLDGGAWEVVDRRAVAQLLNDEMRATAMRDVLDRKAKLGAAVATMEGR